MTEIAVDLITDPAGVPRARAMLQRAEWAARAFARYDKPAVDRVVHAAAQAGAAEVICATSGKALRPYSREVYTAAKRAAEWVLARTAAARSRISRRSARLSASDHWRSSITSTCSRWPGWCSRSPRRPTR